VHVAFNITIHMYILLQNALVSDAGHWRSCGGLAQRSGLSVRSWLVYDAPGSP
jgi:hypothetical protein